MKLIKQNKLEAELEKLKDELENSKEENDNVPKNTEMKEQMITVRDKKEKN